MINKTFLYTLLMAFVLLTACEADYTPKPRGFFRIDLPQKSYTSFDSSFPFKFEYPSYAFIEPDYRSPDEKYWINLQMPRFNATVHFSYKEVDGNLAKYLEDSHTLVSKLIPKADAIYDSLIIDRNRQLFGLSYRVIGNGAASPYQFFVTDSSKNFVRAALYFNTIPNNDSLQPVIDFIIKDMDHIVKTFSWK